jgi:hypothetical protein
MAQIIINEISQNYTYNIGTNSYCCVALPITSCWGPAFEDFNSENVLSKQEWEDKFQDLYGNKVEWMQENTAWTRFPATQAGLEAFLSTYRGPAAGHRLAKDFSYQMAMTLLVSGHDVWCCRLSPGQKAEGLFIVTDGDDKYNNCLKVKAKFPGTFGNNIRLEIRPTIRNRRIVWTYTVHIVDVAGVQSAVEHQPFLFNVTDDHITAFGDTIPHIKEINSRFIDFELIGRLPNGVDEFQLEKEGKRATTPIDLRFDDSHTETPRNGFANERRASMTFALLVGGTDRRAIEDIDGNPIKDGDGNIIIPEDDNHPDAKYANGLMNLAMKHAMVRYRSLSSIYDDFNSMGWEVAINAPYSASNALSSEAAGIADSIEYIGILSEKLNSSDSVVTEQDEAEIIEYKEWLYTNSMYVYELLRDKLIYNPKRIISPGWDDQDFHELDGEGPRRVTLISPMHKMLMDAAYWSRCGTAFLDIPKSAARNAVYRDDADRPNDQGYAQMLARLPAGTDGFDQNVVMYHTNSALFAPWGQYQYVGTNKQNPASPSFQALMIQRAMILNQSIQWEWLLPTNRRHNLRLGTLDYKVPKKLLDIWQKLEGVGVNIITQIPDMGIGLWGNSTLFEVPPVTYNALSNLSTRFLMNAVKDIAYRCGLTITFQYNNDQAYNKFYAGVTPILDTMKNCGAIDDWYVRMQADINGLDQVNANTVIGKIYLVVNGVVNDIIIDLIALPPGEDLDQFRV